jgi:hypothetical protein
MRLLQLATGSGHLIDLHPNVTVLAGLDAAGRRVLIDAVAGLARGSATGTTGLLEAHGVLFDLSDDVLSLLDIDGDDLQPVVVPTDLPRSGDTQGRDWQHAQRVLAQLDERWDIATEELEHREQAVRAASEALARARRDATEAEAGASERIRLIDELTGELDQAQERRRRLLEDRAARTTEAKVAPGRLSDIEASTAEVRARHQQAAIRCSEIAGRLDAARLGIDPDALATAEAAAEQLAKVEAEVAAERAAVATRPADAEAGEEPPEERLARAQGRIDELEKRLAAFGPTEVFDVTNALDHLRALQDGELVPSVEAQELAEQLAQLEVDLAATVGVGATSGGLAAARVRLEAARHALLEAEEAVRNPALDRGVVDRLERAHADLLDALERAEGRFGGARAQRRVEAARAAEQAVLDELGFGSYSDYMMGYSLLHVDPEKEAVLDAARVELAAAEDEWRLLEAETEAELARAERMERRRLLLDDARVLLGRPVPAGEVVAELRAHRVGATVPPGLLDTLQGVLDEAGLALGDEALEREELVLLGEAWLAEANAAVDREQEVRRELVELAEERDLAVAALEAANRAAAGDDPAAEEEREERLRAARAAFDAADARRRAHLEAEAAVGAITDELAIAAEAERRAAEEAAGAEEAVAAAAADIDRLSRELERITAELMALDRRERDATEHLSSLTDHEASSPEELAREVADAEAALAAAEEQLAASSLARHELRAEREAAQAVVESLRQGGRTVDGASLSEEIEWYLLARLAGQRAVSLAGSLPMLLDDALTGLDDEQLAHVLGRLERMADAVQVIVLTDDPAAASWAVAAGEDRAAVVRPEPI